MAPGRPCPGKNAVNDGFTTCRPWLPAPDEHLARAVDVEEGNPDSPLSRCREFTRWRRTVPALKTGDMAFLLSSKGILVILRKDIRDRGEILAAFNLTDSIAEVDVPENGWRAAPLADFSGEPKDGKVALDDYSAAFFIRA